MSNPDHAIVQALLRHDDSVTREFFYRKCYPLFKSVYDNYHTDCSWNLLTRFTYSCSRPAALPASASSRDSSSRARSSHG